MKRCLLIVLILITFTIAHSQQNDFYTKHWSNVYRNELKGLPQSASAIVDTIYRKAKRDNDLQQLTKALIYQSKFALSTQENAETSMIRKFEQEIRDSKPPLTNVLESVLANIYWQYFKENRWTYYQRSNTNGTVDTGDFRTWDTDRMFKEIHQHFQNSLLKAQMLGQIKLESIDDLLIQAENSRKYRPTLYDFLLHNAIEFYSTDESSLTKPSNRFKIDDEKFFLDFENVDLQSADSLSPLRQALILYQDLLAFHKKRRDTTAYVNLQLERINLVAEHSEVPQSDTLQLAALTTLRQDFRSHPASALILFELAAILKQAGDTYTPNRNTDDQFKKAVALKFCNEAISLFPKSDGAQKCAGLRELILHNSLSLMAEKYLPINTPSFTSIRYTNVDSLYFSVRRIPRDMRQTIEKGARNDSIIGSAIKILTPIQEWSVKLKSVGDYQDHTTEVVLPPLQQGSYLIVVTPTKVLAVDGIFGYAVIQVTNLALVEYASQNEHHYRVVDRNNGEPIGGAEIHLETTYFNSDLRRIDEHLTTDKDGEAIIKKQDRYAPTLTATVQHQDDTAAFGNYYIFPARGKSKEEQVTTARSFVFTDRSIYRPGQTVYFKGILIKRKGDKSSVVAGQYVAVHLEDVNGSEVGYLRVKTNAYGSVSGEFQLPSAGLTGEYALYVDEDDEGDSRFYYDLDDFQYDEHLISVEEYKRPTFEVIFEPVTATFALHDTVTAIGVAEAYSGSAVAGSKVSYHVTRQVRYPRWHYWTYDREYSEAVEIAHGETVTDSKGKFSIDFKAIPDADVSPDQKPIFVYEIVSDVTDINGETRSSTTQVKVGYHTVLATINTTPQVDLRKRDNVVGITTENLNGQFVPLRGKVKIFKLKAPDSPVRERPWEAPDLPVLSEQQFNELFPHDSYAGSSDPKKWSNEKLLLELPFDTQSSKELTYSVEAGWPLGNYRMELAAVDSVGQIVNDFFYFTVVDSRSTEVADNALVVFEVDKTSYDAGDVVRLTVGSASPDVTFYIHVERNSDVTKTYVEHFSGNTKTIFIPVMGEKQGSFAVSCSGAAYNSFVYKTINIPVVSKSQQFEIETITFKDKLRTGARETWSFSIKGADSAPMEAEVLASMYDASLDQFKPHDWSFQPIGESIYFARVLVNGRQSFGEEYFQIRNLSYSGRLGKYQYYDRFDWFGFSFNRNSWTQREYLDRLYSSGIALDAPSRVRIRNDKGGKAGNIYGHIVDNNGEVLTGVNIVIKGTTIGTVSDMNGNYMIHADKNDVIVYSFIGYAAAEARVGRKNTIDVVMEPDITELSEVVVTAYGIQTKKQAMAYAVSAVEIEAPGEIVFEAALEGQASGVQVESDGQLYAFSIRGASTMSDAPPLYVIDGVIVDASRLNASDVASMQVLKGSAVTTLYGARAANGVIVIATKSGQQKMDEELAKISTRKNFNETAFFFPHLSTNEEGRIQFTFTSPESLTRWKLQLLAHTKDLLTTTKTLQAVTQKELMVTPNAPRFLRVGDEVVFAVKIANLSARKLNGKIGLQLTDAITGRDVNVIFGNAARNKTFTINAKGNTDISWTLKVPDGVGALQYRVVAKAGNFSDGEQNALPVLTNRTLVTETMPLFVRASQTKAFHLDKLRDSQSTTLKHHRLTLEATSNPAWYAVQSLPYLMEFPYECAEQLFSRYYANALGAHIIQANPAIREVFDKWSSLGGLTSDLEKNAELKSMFIEETPWLRDARDETERKKRLSFLFEVNKLKTQMTSVLNKLEDMQFHSGGFPWFAGDWYANRFITQHIAVTYGHLKKLNVPDYADEKEMIQKAVRYLDSEFLKGYEALLKEAQWSTSNAKNPGEQNRLSAEYLAKRRINDHIVHYLYMKSFFEKEVPEGQLREAIGYYMKQSAEFWQDFRLYSKGMIALIHHRDGNAMLAKDIIKSLDENAVRSEELGMYWKENTGGLYWHEAEIETQALMIEAFAEIGVDVANQDSAQRKAIDELRLWLLKNKQTTQWKTTKATTEAVYALLMNGTDWLSLDDEVAITVGSVKIAPDAQGNPEVATGYFKQTWDGDEITPQMASVTFAKKGEGVAWGGLYWQYFEDLDKTTPAETPLKLKRRIFVVSNTDRGELLTDISGVDLKPGDRLRVRIELAADRPMEFLHMKDMRAAGLEPIDVLSEYKRQEQLGYYQSTRDASTNFFFDYVPKGVYVFEYDLRVNNKGNFSNGITTIQSMYAPEFSSHSEGVRVEVK